jgi:hypothetical protein
MSASLAISGSRGVFRHSWWDAPLVALAMAQGAVVFAFPTLLTVAFGLWWNSNTISHYFIHKPFFASRWLNRLFGCYLSVLLGIPQTLWRDRHLAHHAGIAWRLRFTPQFALETGLVVGLWAVLLSVTPVFFLTAYLPGFALGLALCWLHGYHEHVRGTVSHHGRLYNFVFFNDGYHVEHHDRMATHWTELPRQARADVLVSRWPAVLRWLEVFNLENLERLVVRSRLLQWFVLATHRRAFRALLPELGTVTRVGIVGGGLFPRTALILRELLPKARLVIIDSDAANLLTAQTFSLGDTEFVNERYHPGRHSGFDLVVIPLAYVGSRDRLSRDPPAPNLLVHDWIWHTSPRFAVVSWFLLKRLNLVKQ